jgi:hypothetical protein
MLPLRQGELAPGEEKIYGSEVGVIALIASGRCVDARSAPGAVRERLYREDRVALRRLLYVEAFGRQQKPDRKVRRLVKRPGEIRIAVLDIVLPLLLSLLRLSLFTHRQLEAKCPTFTKRLRSPASSTMVQAITGADARHGEQHLVFRPGFDALQNRALDQFRSTY